MHSLWALLLVPIAVVTHSGCDDASLEPGGGDAAAAQDGAIGDAASDGSAAADASHTQDAAQGGEGDGAAADGAAADGAASDAASEGGEDAGGGEPCDPSKGGRTSSPGQYEGYSDPQYPGHQRSSFYVEVRDGTRLAMDLFRPVDDTGAVVETPLPVLWMHTPYNRRNFYTGPTAETYPGFALRLVEYGYVVAVVDFRGVYASFGTNVAYNRGEWVEAARMDAYDITEWLAAQPWSSGKIGMWGCSATGGSQIQAATTAPPHLRAIFPMSCEFDAYHPFGVDGGRAPESGNTREPPGGGSSATRDAMAVAVDGEDGEALLDEAIAEHADNIENPGQVPYRDSVSPEIGGDPWWIMTSPHTYLDALNEAGVGIYLAANWNEGATKHGSFFTFNNVEQHTKLLVGPAGHCEWTAVKDETGFDLVVEELRFFDHWLKDVDNCVMEEAPVYFYTYNAEGDGWQAANEWPLPEEQRTPYYLGASNSLGTNAPGATETPDTAMATEEAELVYETAPLEQAVQVTGHPVADLWVSSTATDGDFLVTIEDVAPDDTATSYFMTGSLRASHRALEDPPYDNLGLPWHPFTEAAVQPLVPDEPTLLRFDLLPISIVFPEGHRIRVRVRFADQYTPEQDPTPTVSIYHDADHPSAITLPVIP